MRTQGSFLKRVAKSTLALAIFGLAGQAMATEYVVKYKEGNGLRSFTQSLTDIDGVKVLDTHEFGRLVKIDTGSVKSLAETRMITEIMDMPNVEYVVENVKFHAIGDAPNDPSYSKQWSMKKVNAVKAWDTTKGNKEVVVAVIDTGVDYTHEDLKSQIWTNTKEIAGNGIDDDNNGFIDDVRGWDFNKNDNDPMDETSSRNPGHGTHCSGIIGAAGNNGVGIAGMAQQLSIMPVRFLGADGSGDLMAGAKSIDYAVNNGANIISASWGAEVKRSQMQPIMEAIERANKKNVIFVAAAANSGKNNDTNEFYPANVGLPNAISVAASGPQDEKPSWSNYGKAKVHVAAPGLNIFSTLPKGRYANLSGTSMATPLVSGLVALLKAQAIADSKDLTGPIARSILQSTGADTKIEVACGCRVDAAKALEALSNDSLTVVPAASTVAENGTEKFTGFGGKAPYTFTSSNTAVGTITEAGDFKAVSKGDTVLTIKDATGKTAQSKKIYVGFSQGNGGGDGGNGGGGGNGQCPLPSKEMCDGLCKSIPTLPWCS